MATIVDVAERAGVSISTVSHVVNGTRRVAEKTRASVLKAIEETGYRQDALARSLRRSLTDSIGLVVSDTGQPAFADMVRGVEAEATKAGYTLLLANSGEDPEQEARTLEALSARRVDGLIVAPSAGSSGEAIDAIRNSGTPVVLMDRVGSGDSGDQVGVENLAPVRELVAHLVGHGCRAIALAAGNLNVSTISERYLGYAQAVKEAGFTVHPGHVITGSGLSQETCAAALDMLGDRGPLVPPDAVVCSSTETAIGVLEAASRLGLRIPDDLKIAVFDGFPHADLFEPRLTTVEQPAFEIGVTAMRLLQKRITQKPGDGEAWGSEVIRLKPRIVYRTSCGCAS
ncbi:LacI family DNA-binding transcriptional regulator [Streptomyces sp. NBC_00009]|uniref:LacI family DNA-binding transcriptional regulator n=1 Tax=Streptomyces sp. NBC_00009 TaxID=2975620 RepID=UPI0032449F11